MATASSNLYSFFVNVIYNVLMNNVTTMSVHNGTLDLLTNSNQALNESWVSGNAGPDIESQLQAIINAATPGSGGNPPTGNDTEAGLLDQFIQNNLLQGTPEFLSQYSQQVVLQLMGLLSQCASYNPMSGDGGHLSVDSNALNSLNSIVSAQQNYEVQPLQNEAKLEGSVLQQDSSAQQVISNCGDAVQGVFSNFSSLLQSY